MFSKKSGPKAFVRCEVIIMDKLNEQPVGVFCGASEAEAIRAACSNLLESPIVKSFPDDFECIVHTFNVPDVREPLSFLGEVFNPTKEV